MIYRRSLSLLLFTACVSVSAATAGAADSLLFSPQAIIRWEHHAFAGETDYTLAEQAAGSAVHAVCAGNAASGLFLRQEIDLRKTPIIEWRWRVGETLSGMDETKKAGDDYPARLYVVDEHGIFKWRTRALNYVWASRQPAGTDWPNAFASQAHMIAVRSGAPVKENQWFVERRNIRADFRHYHDRDVTRINVVAIMTDCDNTGQRTQAWYGEIRFLPE